MDFEQKLREKNEYSEIEIQHKLETVSRLSCEKISWRKVKNDEAYHNLDDDSLTALRDLIKDQKNRKGYLKDITRKLKKTNKNALDNEGRLAERFNSDITFRKCMGSKIGLNLDNAIIMKINKDKLPNYLVKQSDLWKELKYGTEETSPTSKSDHCILCDDKIIATLSLKSGKGRLSSGDPYEINAIFRSVLMSKEDYKNNEELKKKIHDLTEYMKTFMKWGNKYKHELSYYKNKNDLEKNYNENPNQNIDTKWYAEYLKVHDHCMKKWDDLKTNHEEYIRDILFECASGENKFKNNIGRADWLIETENSKSTEIVKLFKLDKRTPELDQYLMDCVPKITSIFAIKSVGRKLWQRFL